MSAKSTAASRQEHQAVHVIGIGRTGAAYVEALLRTGEIEDLLSAPGGCCAAMTIDVGEDDMFVPNDYAASMRKRVDSRGIAVDRFHYESVLLSAPSDAGFAQELDAARAPFKAATGQELIARVPGEAQLPSAGQHTPRALAKALGAIRMHVGSKPIDVALRRFAEHVAKSPGASTVLVAFGLAGGTGSGMALDVAQALKALLPKQAQIAGIGQMSHSGDGDYHDSLAQTMALDAVDASTGAGKKASAFSGGFFVVLAEHSWQRLTAYTSTGVREVRQRFKQMVTNRFVADSFMRWATADGCAHLARVLAQGGDKWILFDVAKLTHPGVQVLPGEAASRWDSVLQQWIGFTPQFSGIGNTFKADSAEIHLHAARHMKADMMEGELKKVIASAFLNGKESAIATYRTEFFDALTAYANVILPGATKSDLVAYQGAKAALNSFSAAERALETA